MKVATTWESCVCERACVCVVVREERKEEEELMNRGGSTIVSTPYLDQEKQYMISRVVMKQMFLRTLLIFTKPNTTVWYQFEIK